MSVQACVVLPLSKYESMEEQLINPPSIEKDNSEKEEKKMKDELEAQPPPESEEEAVEKDAEAFNESKDEKASCGVAISKKVKTLVKNRNLANVHFEKMLKAIQEYKGDDKLNLSNLSQLVRQACGKSTKKLPNEEEFYNYLIKHNLINFVRNFKKLAQHFPYFMKV